MNNAIAVDISKIDPRLQNLSYSSLGTLHTCPRKFQLDRLGSIEESNDRDGTQNLTFAFGHAVGDGIQQVLEGKEEQQILFNLFLGWDADILEENTKQKKSFFHAMLAVQKFIFMRKCEFLDGYELLEYNGKPACELSFRITFPDGFKYRGFVDAVLRHKETGKILVLEVKTSSATNLNAATFKNSAQAIGYSVVLDVIAPDVSAYEVQYLVYMTKAAEYEMLSFNKSYLQRALWIRELLLDIEVIKLYASQNIYPMRGESCFNFFRECEYMGLCTLSTARLIKPYVPPEVEETFQIELTLADLVQTQLDKNAVATAAHEYIPSTVMQHDGEIL